MEKRAPPQGKQLRIGRVSLPRQIYLITIVTKSRARLFAQHEMAATASKCFYDKTIICHAETLAFVVMHDHIHWLMQLKETASLSEAVRRYKAKVSRLFGGRIWQHGFHDHALRAEEDIIGVARYLVANPLRAGLCDKIGNYPYWNAKWL
jgi:REP element-mobilizing transposase RayT